jgi:hypothetical protein
MSSGFKILRDGDIVFVLGNGIGHAFNIKLVSRVLIEDYFGGWEKLFVSIWAGGVSAICISEASPDEVRQMLSDTPWVKIIPPTPRKS